MIQKGTSLSKSQGLSEATKMLELINSKHDGLVVIFDADTGEMMSTKKGMCHHEVADILNDVIKMVKKDELEQVKEATEEELKEIQKVEKKKKHTN